MRALAACQCGTLVLALRCINSFIAQSLEVYDVMLTKKVYEGHGHSTADSLDCVQQGPHSPAQPWLRAPWQTRPRRQRRLAAAR